MKPAQSHTTNPLPVPPVCVTINVSPKATPQTSTPQNPQPSLEVESLEQAITLLHEALERVVETAQFANQLLNKIKASTTQIATRSPEHRPANRPLLEIQTLGGLEVRLDAKPVRFPFAKCGELLVWLALHGPATRDQICDVLWNGYVTQSNLEYFRVIVRRIRAALANAGNLGANLLVFERGLYRLSNQLEVRLDALELAAALKIPSSERLWTALEAYRGEYHQRMDRPGTQRDR